MRSCVRPKLRGVVWVLLSRAATVSREFAREMRRLNHGGNGLPAGSDMRRERIRGFKAALAERYHGQTRCC